MSAPPAVSPPAVSPTVVVTGGAGFIGLNLVSAFLAAGARVLSFDMRPPPARAAAVFAAHPGFGGWRSGDVVDRAALVDVLGACGAGILVHAAAITAGAARERADPERIVTVNLAGTAAAMRAAHLAGVGRVLLLSTAAVHGDAPPGAVLDERTERHPRTLYAVTKSAAEDVALRLADLHGTTLRIARLGWVFGAWEHDTGLRDSISLLHHLTRQARAGLPLSLSEDVARDWCPAPAVAAAMVRLALAERSRHIRYNVVSGRLWRLSDWCAALQRRLPGVEIPVATTVPPPEARLSPDRFAADFGPVATTTIDEDARDYLAWLETHGMENTA